MPKPDLFRFNKDSFRVFELKGDCWTVTGQQPRVTTCSGPRGTCQAQIIQNTVERGAVSIFVFVFLCSQGGTITEDATQITVDGYDFYRVLEGDYPGRDYRWSPKRSESEPGWA